MKDSAVTTRPGGSEPRSAKKAVKYSSVEFLVKGLFAHYQFKIWCMGSSPMCFFVKENSDILSRLKVGDTLNMKYYSNDSAYPPESLTTQIRDITRKEQGQFRGHCLVGLQILEDQDQVNLI